MYTPPPPTEPQPSRFLISLSPRVWAMVGITAVLLVILGCALLSVDYFYAPPCGCQPLPFDPALSVFVSTAWPA